VPDGGMMADTDICEYTPDEMMASGMKCLVDNFGIVNA
jgi:hypothetical protein